MCQTLKKLFVICVSIVLVVSCFTSVSASGLSNDTYSKIRNALCAAEGIKAEMGLSHVDFEAFTVGKPIYVYDFKGNTLVKNR